jgi:adenine-specific DNA methylase
MPIRSKHLEALLGRIRVHPFPARMAASIPFSELMQHHKQLSVLDPMAGSGTTLAVAKKLGHRACGFDSDPLAVLIARVGCTEVDPSRIAAKAEQVLARAKSLYRTILAGDAYPMGADEETRAYVRYWFDSTNRRQLTALLRSIDEEADSAAQRVFRCAVSRMIIVKSCGASRAMDAAHSRPHRVYRYGPVMPLSHFMASVERVVSAIPFTRGERLPQASIRQGDARRLPIKSESIDLIITSPPYLNAIDYLRGHRLSLVWFGYSLSELRAMRARAVGCERSLRGLVPEELLRRFNALGAPPRLRGMIEHYASDLAAILRTCERVLKPSGRVILVVGDSTIGGRRIRTANGLESLARQAGLHVVCSKSRRIAFDRRYLPPPCASRYSPLAKRMRSETILELTK